MFTVKYVPEWFPGAEFHKLAKAYRANARQAFEKPYLEVKRQMVRPLDAVKVYPLTCSERQKEGTARKSLVASFLEESPNRTQTEEEFIMFTMGDL